MRKAIRDEPGSFTIQVQNASDPAAAVNALERARDDIAALDGGWQSAPGLRPGDTNGPKYVSSVLPAGTGPVISVDGGFTPLKVLLTIPDIIAARLTEAGVIDAKVTCPDEGGTLTGGLDRLTRAVVLRLFPPVTSRDPPELPPRVLDEAFRWVTGDLGDSDELWAAVEVMEFPIAVGEARRFLDQCDNLRPANCCLVAGRPPTPPPKRARREAWSDADWIYQDMLARLGPRVRVAYCDFENVTLAAGGPDDSDQDLLDTFDRLRDLAVRLAPEVSYAIIEIQDQFRSVRHASESPEHAGSTVGQKWDVLVFDAFPYQILGPGHLRRLGGAPPGSRELSEGRVELFVGRPSDWLPTMRTSGQTLLRPCLLRRGQASALIEAQFGQGDPVPRSPLSAERIARLQEVVSRGVFYAHWRQGLGFSQLFDLDRPVSLHLHTAARSARTMWFEGSARAQPIYDELSAELLGTVEGWVVGDGTGDLWAITGQICFQLDTGDALDFFAYWAANPGGVWLIALLPGGAVRLANVGGVVPVVDVGPGPEGVTLVGGRLRGQGYPPGSLHAEQDSLALFTSLTDVARRVAGDIAYGFISLENLNFRGSWSWVGQGGEQPRAVAPICHEFVFDAYPYQVLTEGHVARLEVPPESARRLTEGRVELSIGEPTDWLPVVQDAGRRLLAPCLLTRAEAAHLRH